MMIFVNQLQKSKIRCKSAIKPIIQCLAPFAPHIAEEIWQKMGEEGFVSMAPWPKYDENLAKAEKVVIAIQVNGKTRGKGDFDFDVDQDTVMDVAKEIPFIKTLLEEKKDIRKVIFVPNRIMNLII